MHAKGFVAGFLAEIPIAGICIDSNDNIVLHGRFRRSFYYSKTLGGIVPPEHWDETSDEGWITASPYSDIYQLGLLLWRLATSDNKELNPMLCTMAGCTRGSGGKCTEVHADPIQLPPLGEDIPQYFQEIIAACRSADPSERTPAWQLLKMFPRNLAEVAKSYSSPTGDCATQNTKSSDFVLGRARINPPAQLVRLENLFDMYDLITCCSLCGKTASSHHFHCKICTSGDYDLCPECFSRGAHCADLSHFLEEVSIAQEKPRYHSSVQQTGQRESIAL